MMKRCKEMAQTNISFQLNSTLLESCLAKATRNIVTSRFIVLSYWFEQKRWRKHENIKWLRIISFHLTAHWRCKCKVIIRKSPSKVHEGEEMHYRNADNLHFSYTFPFTFPVTRTNESFSSFFLISTWAFRSFSSLTFPARMKRCEAHFLSCVMSAREMLEKSREKGRVMGKKLSLLMAY